MKNLKLFFLCALIGLSSYMQAYIDGIFVLTLPETAESQNGPKTIILCSDLHEGYATGKTDAKAIIDAAKRLNAHIIVEDSGIPIIAIMPSHFWAPIDLDCLAKIADEFLGNPVHFNADRQYVPGKRWQDYDKETPLFFLAQRCYEQKIPVANVEFRQALTASLKGLPISAAQVKDKVELILDEIDRYDDRPPLENIYQELSKTARDQLQQSPLFQRLFSCYMPLNWALVECGDDRFREECLNFCRNLDVAIAEEGKSLVELVAPDRYDVSSTFKEFIEYAQKELSGLSSEKLFERTLKSSFSRVLDARILHEIFASQAQPVIVCAGADHILSVWKRLQALGYVLSELSVGQYSHEFNNCSPVFAWAYDKIFKNYEIKPVHPKQFFDNFIKRGQCAKSEIVEQVVSHGAPQANPGSGFTCAFCHKYGTEFKLCSRCQSAYYCSGECQKDDWKNHKKICNKIIH